jgi:TolB-like protein
MPSLSEKLGVQNVVEGTVREDKNRLRITAKVLSSDGFQLSTHRFETEASDESLFQIQEQITTAFISRVRPEQSRREELSSWRKPREACFRVATAWTVSGCHGPLR